MKPDEATLLLGVAHIIGGGLRGVVAPFAHGVNLRGTFGQGTARRGQLVNHVRRRRNRPVRITARRDHRLRRKHRDDFGLTYGLDG